VNNTNWENIVNWVNDIWAKVSPSLKTHIWVICNLVISLTFSLLPLMISAAVRASTDNTNLEAVFSQLLLADTLFLYCSAFIAPLVMLTISIMINRRKGQFFLYPIALLGSFYVVILGALMYSGVVARNLFSLGESVSEFSYPTSADVSIIFVTLLVWYYCMYKESYSPKDPSSNYQAEQKSKFKKFDGMIN
jgi:hypothetical protein